MSNDIRTTEEAPEDSRALRVVVFIMSVLCVVSSSFFVKTEWWMTALFLLLIVIGSLLSYKYRHNEPSWMKYIWWVGILLVGANAFHEFMGPLRDEFDFVSPFVHFLCGVFAFVTFSMKTRTDLNTASGLGLILLCLSAPVAKGLPYGICIFGYLALGAVMMYYDCVSRTLTSWLSKPIGAAPEVQFAQKKAGRAPRGNTIVLLTIVPLLALAMFVYVPRADEFLDKVWAYTKTMKIEYLTDMFYKAATPPVSTEHRAQAGREWFNKNKDAKQLAMTGKYAKTKAELDMIKELDEAKKKAPVVDKTDKDKEKKKPEKKVATEDITKPEKAADKKNEKKKGGKLELNKDKEAEKKSKAEPGKDTVGAKKEKDADDVEKKKPDNKGDQKKVDKKDVNSKDVDPNIVVDQEQAAKDAKRDAAQAIKDAEKNKAKDKKAGAADTKSGAPEKSPAGQGKDGKGKGKGKDGGKGDSKKGEGQGAKGHGKDGGNKSGGGKKGGKIKKASKDKDAKPPATPPVGEPVIGGDNNLKVEEKNDDLDERLVLTVKSRRLVYLRRQIYDYFNGRVWKRATPNKKLPKIETIKVVDGEIKREPKKIVQAAKPVPVRIQKSGPVIMPTSPDIIRGSQPSVFGNTTAQTSVLSGNTQATTPAEPIRVEQPKAAPEAKTDAADDTEKEDPSIVHPFVFQQTERPIFRVGMADALKVESTLPTVELVQEIKIRAKTIGVVVPGGWIEQEVKLPKELMKINVDQLGVITTPSPLNKGMEIKVKTELPIYPIEAMRAEQPLTAKLEDQLRRKHAQYLQLPGTVTEELFKLGEDNSDPRFNWFVQSQQICDYLRENYEYDKMRDVDAESKDLVQDFLFDRKKGSSTDFASAFVVLTRCVGIPSRLVTGFSPGEWNQMSGEQEVKMKHIHAWAEVFIPEFGWVPFDATPDGILPSQQRENRYSQKEVEKQLGLDKKAFNLTLSDLVSYLVSATIALAIGFVAFKVLVGLYRRWREGHMGRGPEWGLYKKVAKAIKKSMRLTRAPSETPTDFLERVRLVVSEQKALGKNSPEMLPEALETFLKTYSAVYFGKRTDELEHLKYHATQVTQVTRKIKPTDVAIADQKSAVRRKDKFDESTASSAIRRKK
ncbi:MAG: transglutaminaseTgpA domain-containing protein [Candidatus Melainabacteria bacterium]|nr:transglutaminaseTgpA domain-containing protein [Candidatus Melainabacteria bacterium]